MSILNEIVSNIKTNDDEQKNSSAPAKFLNNLDDCNEQVGAFNIKIFGIGGAGCNVISNIYHFRQ
jgi:cell division GTPase FtsZ